MLLLRGALPLGFAPGPARPSRAAPAAPDAAAAVGDLRSATVADRSLLLLPFLVPVLSWASYEEVVASVTWTINSLTPGDWLAVDGGRQQVQELQPVINGVVLPAVSFALGTLSATSIQSLRQRQVSLRACLNKEACLIDLLSSALETIFDGPRRHLERQNALALLRAYAQRTIAESQHGLDTAALERAGAVNTELRSLNRLLHRSPAIREGLFHEAGLEGFAAPEAPPEAAHGPPPERERAPPAAAPAESRFFITTEFNCQSAVKELLAARSERLALLLTTFPPVFWLTQGLLGGSVVLAFLLETDYQALQFLDRFQLRLLFTMLLSALSGLAIILWDLNDPFRGAFRITPAAQQLQPVVDALDAALGEAPGDVMHADRLEGR